MRNQSIDETTRKATTAFMAKLARQFQISGALLFGSRARSDHTSESDADIAVFLKGKSSHFIKTRFAMDDIAYEVLLDTGIRIQPLPIWQDEWSNPENYSNPSLLRNVQAEGIPL
jgi:predicted nucleotidyltransferase